jgi:hypothetical protein
MTLPASFLQHIEQHPCFTGCYNSASGVQACLDPNHPLVPQVVVSCTECFASFAVLTSLLTSGISSMTLADQLSHHVRMRRGYVLSVSGYFTNGPGFWFSGAYLGRGLFLVGGDRSRKLGSDLDQLLLAFQHNVMNLPDPRMIDPRQYVAQTVYSRFTAQSVCTPDKQALLASGHVSAVSQPGWQKLSLLEFLPLSTAPAAPSAVPPAASRRAAAKPTTRAPLKPGDICPICGAEVRTRHLLRNTFVGCMC